MKVLVTATNYSKYCARGKKLLEDAGVEIIENPHQRPYTFEELEKIVGDIDGVVAGIDKWDESVFKLAPKLKGIARFGVGVDNINLNDAKKYGVAVANTPGINSSAVAEQAAALILSVTRNVAFLNQSVRRGEWYRPMVHELKRQTVGLMGFGAIARQLTMRLKGFGPKIIAYDKFPNEAAAKELGVELVSLEDVLKRSDIISLHMPALEDTVHIVNDENIAKMKDGVIIINTARGALADEKAVERGLKSGKIGGYGTDVFESEPMKADNPLFAFPNYVATPHVSAETYENCDETGIATANILLSVFRGEKPKTSLVWPEK